MRNERNIKSQRYSFALRRICEKCRILADKAIENVGHGESEESAIGACAFFMQEQRMYRQIIPDIIKELAESEDKE